MNFKNQLSDNGDKLLEIKFPVVRRLLVLDSSWTLEAIRERKLEDSITCRDLDGFFEHVWSVHPFASLVTSEQWTSKQGQPEYHELNATNSFVEGKAGRFYMFRKFPTCPLNCPMFYLVF